MKTLVEYLRHAAECEALARNATNEEERRLLTEMIKTWRSLAEQRAASTGASVDEALRKLSDEATKNASSRLPPAPPKKFKPT